MRRIREEEGGGWTQSQESLRIFRTTPGTSEKKRRRVPSTSQAIIHAPAKKNTIPQNENFAGKILGGTLLFLENAVSV